MNALRLQGSFFLIEYVSRRSIWQTTENAEEIRTSRRDVSIRLASHSESRVVPARRDALRAHTRGTPRTSLE